MTATLPRLDRRRFVADLIGRLPEDTLIVTGLGSPSYDVFSAGDRPGTFYLWGAMGAAARSPSASPSRSRTARSSPSPATANTSWASVLWPPSEPNSRPI